jgi:hypothetical protein
MIKATVTTFKQEYAQAQLPIVEHFEGQDVLESVSTYVNNTLSTMEDGLVTVQYSKKGENNDQS